MGGGGGVRPCRRRAALAVACLCGSVCGRWAAERAGGSLPGMGAFCCDVLMAARVGGGGDGLCGRVAVVGCAVAGRKASGPRRVGQRGCLACSGLDVAAESGGRARWARGQ